MLACMAELRCIECTWPVGARLAVLKGALARQALQQRWALLHCQH